LLIQIQRFKNDKKKCRFNRIVCKSRKVLKCYRKLNAKGCFRPRCCKLYFRGNNLVAKRCRKVGRIRCPVRIFHKCNKKKKLNLDVN